MPSPFSICRLAGSNFLAIDHAAIPNGDFTEASHLGGRADLIELARIFEQEEQRRWLSFMFCELMELSNEGEVAFENFRDGSWLLLKYSV